MSTALALASVTALLKDLLENALAKELPPTDREDGRRDREDRW